ncbi:MAG: alpha-mannosidase [Clostridia bacterium]|nr:alpha-mannosidase [Clostridia bacterium]
MKNNKKKIFTIATAHLDTCWLWTYEKTAKTFVPGTLKENFALFRRYPDYKFNFEGSNRYELMEEYYPEEFEKLKGYIKEGRWHPCGSCYENGDVNTPSPEALTRNILYGNGYFREKFGVESNDIFLPDCFGFGRALPSIAAHSGLTGFSTQKLTWGGSVDVPFDIGRWTGNDGKGIWCALKPSNYAGVSRNVRTRKDVLANLAENTEKYDNPRTFVYHGTGDRGGAPAPSSVRSIIKAAKLNDATDTDVLFSTTKEFFDELENMSDEAKAKMPVYDGELLLTEHGAGSYTSRTVTKRWNRRSELLADAAERFSVAAMAEGTAEYPQQIIDNAWKKVILHQFHDDITGTSFEECYKRSHNDYVQAMHSFSAEYTNAVKALSGNIDTSFVKGVAVVVSNPVQSTALRFQAVSAVVDADTAKPYVRVFDVNGNETPSQMKLQEDGRVLVSFMAQVPSCGIRVYDVQFSDEKSELTTELKYSENIIENKYIRVTLDEKGDIASVYNKKENYEALSESIRLAVFHDVESYAWPSWEVKLADMSRAPYMYPAAARITAEENGPVLCRIRIERKAGKSTFTQIISLDSESDYVSVENEIDWREEASMLKAEFRLKAENENADYDIGFGYTQRKTNTERLFEVPAQKWAGITDGKNGNGTAIFSDSRTGWDKPDSSTLRLTCIHTPLNNYRWECSQHLLDLGINRFGFAVYPHSGNTERIIAKADEFCQKMHTFVTDKHSGELSDMYSAVKINTDKVRVSAVKKAQESDDIIVRVCEYTGECCENTVLEFPFEIAEAYEVRGDEMVIGSVPAKGNKLVFDMGKNEIRSFALKINKKVSQENCTPVDLPYNAVAVTDNKSAHKSTLRNGISVPKELMPKEILTSGVSYKLPQGEMNGLVCDGQTLNIGEGYSAVSLLITSLSGDKDAVFTVGGKQVTVRVQDCFEAIGQWDLMRTKTMAYIKTEPQLLSFSHSHNKNGDMIAKQFYFFGAEIALNGADSLVLPKDKDILILSASALKNASFFKKSSEHFDTMKKRDFDYSFSSYAVKASQPAKFEKILDKLIDRTYSPNIKAFTMYSKLSLGELYYYLRNIPALAMYPSRKKKALKRK